MNTYAHPGKPCEMCKFLPNFCKIGCDRISVKSRDGAKRTLGGHRAPDKILGEKRKNPQNTKIFTVHCLDDQIIVKLAFWKVRYYIYSKNVETSLSSESDPDIEFGSLFIKKRA